MNTPWATVVGEVADVKEGSPDQPSKQQFYKSDPQVLPMAGSLATPDALIGDGGWIVLRTAIDPKLIESELRSTVRSIDPQLPLTQVQTMEEAISSTEAPRRFNTALISSFAAAALLLAILGIYSVIAFTVALRVQEIAIRMALGSQRSDIVRLILVSGAKLAVIGCVLGIAGAASTSHLLGSMLFGVSAFDPIVMVLGSVCVLLLTLAASLLPARRASSIDPMQALRTQ
jgi:ABC-type antimicrobial peptide transport system permease subunit